MLDSAFASHFGGLPDPRVPRSRQHALLDMLVIALLAVVCGAEGWEDIALFGRSKEPWLRERLGLSLENGVPSDDTFRRVFARLDPEEFGRRFSAWVQGLREVSGGQIAVDGKCLRGSFDGAFGQPAILLVRVFAQEERLVLGASRVGEATNEIPCAAALLSMLDLGGALVTADAMHCQKHTAAQIVDQGADYLLSVKENQPTLAEAVAGYIDWVEGHSARHEWQARASGRRLEEHEESDWGHARSESRKTSVVTLAEEDPDWRHLLPEWRGLRSLIRVERTRHTGSKTTRETVYYISSRVACARELGGAVRNHWDIENGLHWVLDVTFREDASRIRKGHAPENLATVRNLALNLIRRNSSKGSVRGKRKRAGWDDRYLLELIV